MHCVIKPFTIQAAHSPLSFVWCRCATTTATARCPTRARARPGGRDTTAPCPSVLRYAHTLHPSTYVTCRIAPFHVTYHALLCAHPTLSTLSEPLSPPLRSATTAGPASPRTRASASSGPAPSRTGGCTAGGPCSESPTARPSTPGGPATTVLLLSVCRREGSSSMSAMAVGLRGIVGRGRERKGTK